MIIIDALLVCKVILVLGITIIAIWFFVDTKKEHSKRSEKDVDTTNSKKEE